MLKNSNSKNNVYVIRPFLPPLEEFIPYLRSIWERKWLTNSGPFHEQLEHQLADFLGVKHVALFANGTQALITALQVLKITGEVITTPFSFVATTHALWWNNIKPVFIDIEPEYCNLDPNNIESAITPQTAAVLPVHVYGNHCDMELIQDISDRYGIKVIYDACHAFGVKKEGGSILNFGDLSVLSFHATKVFTTAEGGAIICHDEKTKKRIEYLKNFGFAGEIEVVAFGSNAKMNELQAALGLVQLNHFDEVVERRKVITERYRNQLKDTQGIRFLNDMANTSHNYAYFPIFVDRKRYGKSRDELYENLKKIGVFCRRYFYPLISHFPMYRGLKSSLKDNLPVAEKIAAEVLCLPIYPDIEFEVVDTICALVNGNH